jgi:hypothetical protein
VGAIPVATTSGMLLGYGLKAGGAARAFSAIGALVVSTRHPFWAGLVGIVLHVALLVASSALYASLVRRTNENQFAWAIAVGGGIAAILFVFARASGGSIALVLTPGNLIAIGVIIAITLPIGMRFAPSRV